MSVERVRALVVSMTREERSSLWSALKRSGIHVTEEEDNVETMVRASAHSEAHAAVLKAQVLGPEDCWREVASRKPHWAYEYAMEADIGPHEVTRRGVCGDPRTAYRYALHVEKGFHPDTWSAVKGTEYEDDYRESFDVPEGE